jgi:N-acylglucosamine 2-epimerase
MERYCMNREKGDRMYFTVTEDGRPLRQRRYCHSENFYTIANAEYYANTGDTVRIERARKAYDLVYKLNHGLIEDPVGMGPKTIPETRRSRAFGDPMIYLNVTAVMRRCDPENKALYDQRARECVDEILKYHYKPELKCTLETVGVNGELQTDTTAGRVVNPGHDIEGSWFLQEQANYEGNAELTQTAMQIFDNAIAAGWDKEYGGLLYFIDCLGCPPEAYEHDMKLWWPHNEILIASMMFYRDTGDEKYLNWFNTTADYAEKHFADPEYGEWYGYLRRDGLPTMPACKGSTFKGPFHVPRCLIMLDKMMSEVEAKAQN